MTSTVRGISPDGRAHTIDLESREYTIIYKVSTDDKNDGPLQAATAFGIPSVGDLYAAGNDADNAAVVVSKNVTQAGSPWEWEVEVTYSTDLGSDPSTSQQQADNPLNEPADIVFGFSNRTVLIPGYYNSPLRSFPPTTLEQGIVNPAGELFVPQPEMEISEPVLTITRNVATISFAGLMALANCVNQNPFQGADARTLRLSAPTANRQWHQAAGFYWRVSYAMHYKWDLWDIQILNHGTYYLGSGGAKVREIVSGTPAIVNLTSTGGKLAAGDPPTFTTLQVYREIDFSSLGLL